MLLQCCASTTGPGSVAEITTESRVKNDSVVGKVGINIAARAIKARVRERPSRWVGIAIADVGWDGTSREEPNLDGIRLPFHCINTTFVCVEACTIADGALRESTATLCIGTCIDVVLAVVAVGGTGHIGGALRNDACSGDVGGGQIGSLVVRSLNNVDLAVLKKKSESENTENDAAGSNSL